MSTPEETRYTEAIKYEGVHELKPATELSAGVDLRSLEDVDLSPGQRCLISTGLKIQLPPGTWGLLKSRSGLAVKGLDVKAGVIDADYRGEVKVLLHNSGEVTYPIKAGDRIAQLIILPHVDYSRLFHVQEIQVDTHRGAGGFGSTGST